MSVYQPASNGLFAFVSCRVHTCIYVPVYRRSFAIAHPFFQ